MGLKLNGATSGSIEIDVPAVAGTDTAITIPATTGGEFIVSDSSGNIDLGPLDINGGASDDSVNIDGSGRLLVGTSSSYGIADTIQVVTDTGLNLHRGSANTGASRLDLSKSRNTTYGSNTIVQSGDTLGSIVFRGDDGTDYTTPGGEIKVVVDGTPGANDMPGRLVFSTTADGDNSPTEQLKIDRNGVLYSVPTYNNTTGSTTNPLRIGSDGQIYRSTSSIAYKTDVEDMDDAYADAILNLRPVWYRSTCEGDNPDHSHWGFIAEEVEQVDPRLCSFKDFEVTYNEEGNQVVTPLDTPVVDGVDYASLTPLLLNLIKRQKEQIETLETANASQAATIAALDARLTALEGGTNP